MGLLKKADFYYGSLLSILINSGIVPALFEKEYENRQIYKFATNKDNYLMYTKYSTTPTGTKDFTWSFTFTDRELQEISSLVEENGSLQFAFICCQKSINDTNQEIAIVYWDEFVQCVDLQKVHIQGAQRLSVKLLKGARLFRIYGSKLPDRLEEQDNTIRIERNRITTL